MVEKEELLCGFVGWQGCQNPECGEDDEPAEEDPDLGKHEANQQARDRKEEP